MGVKGLWTYIRENEIFRKVELLLLAQNVRCATRKQPKLLCDFFNLQPSFWDSPTEALIAFGDYPEHAYLYGGDFNLFADRVRCFVAGLRYIGVEPVFFVDGRRGSDDSFEGKLHVLKQRHQQKLSTLEDMQQVCNGSQAIFQAFHCCDTIVSQCLMSLEEVGATIVHCNGEADPEMISYAHCHEESLGILSSDSDFAISSGTVMFPVECFDCEHTLNLTGVVIDDKPGEITCMVVCPSDVALHLGIRENQLPDLASLCGNDYTRDLMHQFFVLTQLGLEGSAVDDIAMWLQDKKIPLLDYQPMREMCIWHPELKTAMEQSYSNYTMEFKEVVPNSEKKAASPLYPEFTERRFLALVKNGVCWLPCCYESITLGQPCFSDVTLPLRKALYFLLGLERVREIGRSLNCACKDVYVPVCVNGTSEIEMGIQCLHVLRKLNQEAKIVGLYKLMSEALNLQAVNEVHAIVKEISKCSFVLTDISWPKVQVAMLCTCLRLIYYLNVISQPPMNLLDSELDALLVACLTCSTGEIPPHFTEIKPSMRTITISEWFSLTVDYCYQLSSLLDLKGNKTEPRHLFYPMAFVSYHISIEANKEETSIAYIQKAMETVLNLHTVRNLRSVIFATEEFSFPFVMSLFAEALDEVVSNKLLLLPKVHSEKGNDDEYSADCEASVEHEHLNTSEKVSCGSEFGTIINAIRSYESKGKSRASVNDELPILEHRETILKLISEFQFVCIGGETGCGKSSQVPQFILQEASSSDPPQQVKVLINQPNLLAAKRLAERVSEERLESLGEEVGYCSSLQRCPSDKETSLTFCTTEYMLQVLQNIDSHSCEYTHIVLDEVHERSIYIDFTMFIVRKLALNCTSLKVVLMSATLQGNLFIDYFKQELGAHRTAPIINSVGLKRFPVEEFFIDELDELVKSKGVCSDAKQRDASRNILKLLEQFKEDPDSLLPLVKAEVTNFAQDVCINLVISQLNPQDVVLVFLPGTSEITDFHAVLIKKFRKLKIFGRYSIFVFNNQVAMEDQKEAFQVPEDGKANIILSNKSLESSLTIPNLNLIINFCVSMVRVYDTQLHTTRLTRRWCSKASCIQRAGRVGRLSEGVAVHLITREFHEKLPEFNPPEIIDSPLSKTVLKAKHTCAKVGISLPSVLLSSLIEPPSQLQFEAALHDLADSGALIHSVHTTISETAETSVLGNFSASLELDLKLCHLVFLGILFGCPIDAVVFAASMSMYQDVFTLPTKIVISSLRQFCTSMARSTFSRNYFDDNCYSNPIMMRNMFIEWLKFRNSSRNVHADRRDTAYRFCAKYAVRVNRLLHFESHVADIAQSLKECIPSGSVLHEELHNLSRINNGNFRMPVFCDTDFFSQVHVSSSVPLSDIRPSLKHLRSHSKFKSKAIHFCSNFMVLKALLAAAASNGFVYGERCCDSQKPNKKSGANKALKIMETEGFQPHKCLVMNLKELEGIDLWEEELDKTDKDAFSRLFRALPSEFLVPEKVYVDQEAAVVQFQSPDHNAGYLLQSIADQIQPGRQVVHYEDIAVSKLPIESDFFWRFGECRKSWEIDNVNALFPSPYHPFGLRWHKLSKDRQHINTKRMNWRNPTANMCMFSELSQPVFGVASNMLSSSSSLNATNLTLLPSMPEGLFMVLAFQNPSSTVELLINRNKMLCQGVRINSQHIHCKDIEKYITASRMKSINKLRENIATLMTFSLNSSLLPLNSCVPALLHIAISGGKVSTKTASVSEPDIELKENLVWEMITPNPLLLDDKMAKTLHYPEFRCSLLNTEPYSMEAVQQRNTDTFSSQSTHSFEYRQTIASKFLIMEEEEERINDPKPSFHEAISTKIQWCGSVDEPVSRSNEVQLSKSLLKLVQEVVRHLQRNNMMEFFSELKVQRRIAFLCKTYELKLDLTFFNDRKHLFELKEVGEEDSEDGEQDFLINLLPNVWDVDDGAESPLLTESLPKSVVSRGTNTDSGNQYNEQQIHAVKVDIASEVGNTQPISDNSGGENKTSKSSTDSVPSRDVSFNVSSVAETKDSKVDTSQFLSESLHQGSEIGEPNNSSISKPPSADTTSISVRHNNGKQSTKQKDNYTSESASHNTTMKQSSYKEVGTASRDARKTEPGKVPQKDSQLGVESFRKADSVCEKKGDKSSKDVQNETSTFSVNQANIMKQSIETSTASGNSKSEVSKQVDSETQMQKEPSKQLTIVQAPIKLETAQDYNNNQTTDKPEQEFTHKEADTVVDKAMQEEGYHQMQDPSLTISKSKTSTTVTSVGQKESGDFKQVLSSSPEVSTQEVKGCKQAETLKQKKDDKAETSINKSRDKARKQVLHVAPSEMSKKQKIVDETCKQPESKSRMKDEPSGIVKEEPCHKVQAHSHSKSSDKNEVVTQMQSTDTHPGPDSVKQRTTEACKPMGTNATAGETGKQGVTASLPAQPSRPHVGGNVKQKSETSLKPGTANHLKEYLVNAISSSGGDVRLSSLRKCYLQYCSEYQRVNNFTYLSKGFLKVYPQTFHLYVNKSDGINYVRLVASKHKTAS